MASLCQLLDVSGSGWTPAQPVLPSREQTSSLQVGPSAAPHRPTLKHSLSGSRVKPEPTSAAPNSLTKVLPLAVPIQTLPALGVRQELTHHHLVSHGEHCIIIFLYLT